MESNALRGNKSQTKKRKVVRSDYEGGRSCDKRDKLVIVRRKRNG